MHSLYKTYNKTSVAIYQLEIDGNIKVKWYHQTCDMSIIWGWLEPYGGGDRISQPVDHHIGHYPTPIFEDI